MRLIESAVTYLGLFFFRNLLWLCVQVVFND